MTPYDASVQMLCDNTLFILMFLLLPPHSIWKSLHLAAPVSPYRTFLPQLAADAQVEAVMRFQSSRLDK